MNDRNRSAPATPVSVESTLAALSWRDAPRMTTATIPGPKSRVLLADAPAVESMTRGGGRFPLVFDEGYGVTVKDPDGNLYIDVSAGVGVSSVGRCHPRVVEAITAQAGRLMHASDISNTRRAELARRIAAIMPPGLRNQCTTYFAQSGSDAVEAAVKFARRITGRNQILAFHGAYHGVWHASNALTTGEQYRKGYGPFMGGVLHAPYPYAYRFPLPTGGKSCEAVCGEYVDYLLNTPYTAADDVAAVIVEPQQGEGGYIAPAPEFLQRVRAAASKHGALLIVDEIQAGAGRSGKMWSVEHSGVEPDLLTWGKGMGGDVAMTGVTLRAELAGRLDDHSQPGTFAGNALAAAVCLANIEILTDPTLNLVPRAGALGEEILVELRGAAATVPVIGDVRGRGLMIGVELVRDRATKEPLDKDAMGRLVIGALERGVITVPCGRYGNVLRLMPSLTIPREYFQRAVGILLDVMRRL
jgi:4-aminobutyrate aminotransferase